MAMVNEKSLEENNLNNISGLYDGYQFQVIAENMKSAILTFDTDQRLTFVNDAFEKITGFKLEELDYDFINCVHPLDREKARELWNKIFTFQDCEDQEFRFVNKNHKVLNLRVFSHALYNYENKHVGAYIRLVSIPPQKQTEDDFQALEDSIKKAIFSAPFPAIIVSESGDTKEINKVWTELTGFSFSDIPNIRQWMALMLGSLSEAEKYFFELTNLVISEKEKEIITKSGQKKVWQFSCSKLGSINDTDSLYLIMGVDLTARKVVEEALKASEANIRAVLNNTSQCFILIDKNYKVQTFNKIAGDFAKSIYGVELKEDLNMKTVISSEDTLDFKNCFEFALQGYPVTIERNIKGKTRKDNWVEMSFTPVYEHSECVKSVCVGVLDINIRKKASQILEASEKRFRSLVQNSSDLTCIIDINKKFKYISPAVKNIFGYKPGKLLYTKYNDYVHPDDQHIFDDAFEKVLSGESVKVEYRFRHKNDDWIYLQSIISDLLSESSIGGVVINARDITETKRTQEDLNESKHFIQRIANSMPNILFLYDVKGYQPIYINQAMKSILGYGIQDFVGNSLVDYSHLMHPEDLQTRIKMSDTTFLATDDEVIESEFRIKDVNNQWRWLHSREVVFSRSSDGQVRQVLGTAEDITRRKNIEDQLAREAFFDTLTGLPNRRYFVDKLKIAIEKQALDSSYCFTVFFLDVDRFKIVNDSLGHHTGDQLLIAISQRLKSSIGEKDVVARLGGDEFTILLDNTANPKKYIRTVEKIQKKLNIPFTLNYLRISATCSIGIAPSNQNYSEPEEVLRDADTAMYRAKNKGKNCYTIFNRQMHDHVLKVLQTEGDLRRAISNHELELYYQPIVSLKNGHISSCEALIRWNHPKKGLIQPVDFLGVAEETGLMLEIDKFALFHACQQNVLWQKKGLPNVRVAVNISLNEVRQKKVRDLVTNTLRQTKLSPHYLEIELTENVLIEDSESNLETLKELSKMGVSLSIDDFGTGYSSLTYIKRLPSNCLKIDQSFIKDSIKDKDTAAIVKSIIGLAHNLNLKVIAEGVETIEQVQFLKDLDCDEAQGYLFGRPMPASKFEKLLSGYPEEFFYKKL
jgi:diguanylate cyclase (GGDEF)-like protein/PAS domain S-box-containing protein